MATRVEWAERVERWERSGLSAEKFARREGYKPNVPSSRSAEVFGSVRSPRFGTGSPMYESRQLRRTASRCQTCALRIAYILSRFLACSGRLRSVSGTFGFTCAALFCLRA
jgi:hypothetical protein